MHNFVQGVTVGGFANRFFRQKTRLPRLTLRQKNAALKDLLDIKMLRHQDFKTSSYSEVQNKKLVTPNSSFVIRNSLPRDCCAPHVSAALGHQILNWTMDTSSLFELRRTKDTSSLFELRRTKNFKILRLILALMCKTRNS